jgi:DNA polymerase V
MHTSPFRSGPSYGNAATVELRPQSNDAFEILHYAVDAARRIWRDGYSYSKAGVILTGLVPADRVQPSLLDAADRARGARLMAAMDAINDESNRNRGRSDSLGGEGR